MSTEHSPEILALAARKGVVWDEHRDAWCRGRAVVVWLHDRGVEWMAPAPDDSCCSDAHPSLEAALSALPDVAPAPGTDDARPSADRVVVTPHLYRRLEALGWPGDSSPVAWVVDALERSRQREEEAAAELGHLRTNVAKVLQPDLDDALLARDEARAELGDAHAALEGLAPDADDDSGSLLSVAGRINRAVERLNESERRSAGTIERQAAELAALDAALGLAGEGRTRYDGDRVEAVGRYRRSIDVVDAALTGRPIPDGGCVAAVQVYVLLRRLREALGAEPDADLVAAVQDLHEQLVAATERRDLAEDRLDTIRAVFGSFSVVRLMLHVEELDAAIKECGPDWFRPGVMVRTLKADAERIAAERDEARAELADAAVASAAELRQLRERAEEAADDANHAQRFKEDVRRALDAKGGQDPVRLIEALRKDAEQVAEMAREVERARDLEVALRDAIGVGFGEDLVEAARAAVTGHQGRTAECVTLRGIAGKADSLRSALRRALPEAGPGDEALVGGVETLAREAAEWRAHRAANPDRAQVAALGAVLTVEAIAERCGLVRDEAGDWRHRGELHVWRHPDGRWTFGRGPHPTEEAALRAYAAAKGIDLAAPAEPVPWTNAGGPNECAHGYAEGIPCPRCDEAKALAAVVFGLGFMRRGSESVETFAARVRRELEIMEAGPPGWVFRAATESWERRPAACPETLDICLGRVLACVRTDEHSTHVDADGSEWKTPAGKRDEQPAPRPYTGDVWGEVIRALPELGLDDMRPMCEARRALGTERYGTPLGYDDGRDHRRDLAEELLDGGAYAWGEGLRRLSADLLRAARDPVQYEAHLAEDEDAADLELDRSHQVADILAAAGVPSGSYVRRIRMLAERARVGDALLDALTDDDGHAAVRALRALVGVPRG